MPKAGFSLARGEQNQGEAPGNSRCDQEASEVALAPIPHAPFLVVAAPALQVDVLGHRLHGEHAVALLSTRRQTLELLGLLSEPLADRGSLSLNTRPRQTLG